jgi:membrane-bound serine protease (ClpP class)
MHYRRWFCILIGMFLLWGYADITRQVHAQERGSVYTVQVDGIVTSVKIDFLRRALRTAEANDATALIIQLSNNGAVLRAIRPFAIELAEAEVPVVVYVAPSGTEAGAPGAFFLSAAHIAAMAPETSFGTPLPLAEVDQTLSEQTQDLVLDDVVQQLRAWNEARGRNTDWINDAVREGVVRTNQQAISTEPPTIDLIASDMDELLVLLEGRVVELVNGEELQLQTLDKTMRTIEPNLWENFLLLLANPTVAFVLLVLGAIAIYSELATPNVGVAAGLGTVLLLGALVGLLVLPVRWLSLLGLVLAFTLIAADLYLPTQGTLTVTGLVLLIIGAMTLIDTAQAPNVFVALWAIIIVALAIAAFAAVTIWLVVRTSSTPVATGQEGLVNRLAEVRKTLDPEGFVFVDGALWRAISEDGVIEAHEWVRISAVHDLRLMVRRIDTEIEIDSQAETES